MATQLFILSTKIAAACGLLLVFTTSCKDEYTLCEESRFVTLNGGFYKARATPDSLRPATTYSIKTLAGAAVLSNVPNSAAFSFALPPGADSAKYVFTLNNLPVDTLSLFYTTQAEMLSPQCGDITTNTITAVKSTKHTIDTVTLFTPAVNTRLAQNIKVFY